MPRSRTGVGIIGAGVISVQYLAALRRCAEVEVLFIADVDVARAQARAHEFAVPGAGTVDELLAVDRIEVVLNLTVPAVHAEISTRILDAGRHVWSEKPLATTRDEADGLLTRAARAGLRIACAPDSVLGAGFQTAVRAVAGGVIGTPLTASVTVLDPGPDIWHPSPEFLFARGGGPLLDLGPYYLTALVWLFGPIRHVAAVRSTARDERVIGSGPRAGVRFPVEAPTHVATVVGLTRGSAEAVLSFQSPVRRRGLEITGTDGMLVAPDPAHFDGASTLWPAGGGEPSTITARGASLGRGTGVVELIRAIHDGRDERASGALAAHVLDAMLGIGESAASESVIRVDHALEVPTALPPDWDPERSANTGAQTGARS